ncbi:hypothetical protein PAXINDRAFT_155650 [Paxillus involutus ATCC 200175]|uniref:Uncharacterized protein n=1 Tax=Paxillus involutus ATCC 200175 TaxID=664439 RepID=A0A0C9U887_PAXIN|nr:hypothetical protein PAXINDRAFT_155650 [Paxillus involutus ATCC 200175]
MEMGHPRVHKTAEAKIIAACKSRCRYYQTHKEHINAKRHMPCQTDAPSESELDVMTLEECLFIVKHTKDQLVVHAKSPQAFAEEILNQYIESMPANDEEEDSGSGDIGIIKRAIEMVASIHVEAHRGQDTIYQMCGVCPEWQASNEACQLMKLVISLLEDILCLAMLGASVLAEVHFLGELMFQRNK